MPADSLQTIGLTRIRRRAATKRASPSRTIFLLFRFFRWRGVINGGIMRWTGSGLFGGRSFKDDVPLHKFLLQYLLEFIERDAQLLEPFPDPPR